MVVIFEHYRQPLIPLLWSYGAGIVAGEKIRPDRCWIFFILAAAVVWLTAALLKKKAAGLIPLVIFFCLGCLAISGYVNPAFPPGHVTGFIGETGWYISGTIINAPVDEPGGNSFFLKPFRIAPHSGLCRSDKSVVSGNLRVKVYGRNPNLVRGAVIAFRSRIREVANFKNPGGFDYKRYLAFQGVFGLTYTPADKINLLAEPAPPRGPKDMVEVVRDRLAARISDNIEGPAAAVLKALILGKRKDLDPSTQKMFNRSGTGHLLAISGLHVGIIATISFFTLTRLLSFIPFLTRRGWVKKTAALSALATVIAYGLIAGMAPSTQRAVIMTAVFLLAFIAEKKPTLINTLALAALIILVAHPPALFSISFQLSFAAVFFIIKGMTAAVPLLENISRRWLKAAVSFVLVSLCAVIGTAPLTTHYFNQASLMGPVANCLMIPLIGFVAVPLGLIGAFSSLFSLGLSLFFFHTAAAVIDFSLIAAKAMATPSWAAMATVTPSALEIACCFVLLWSLTTFFINRRAATTSSLLENQTATTTVRPRLPGIIMIAAALAGMVLTADTAYWIHRRWLHTDLRVTFLDVGQGNSALLEIPGGHRVLIDGGGFTGRSTFDVGEMVVARYLRRNKINTVKTVILTHPDSDHLSGLRYIVDNFNVRSVWSNNEALDSGHYREFVEIINSRGLDMPSFKRLEKTIVINGIRFDILYPPPDFLTRKENRPWSNPNNNSLVTKVTCGKISFLFPGDIMKDAELELIRLAGEKLASTVLAAPHHGSRTSSTSAFLGRVRPDKVVVSAGYQNRYHYPHAEVMKRYAAANAVVYCTGRDGAVIMKTRGDAVRTKTFLTGAKNPKPPRPGLPEMKQPRNLR